MKKALKITLLVAAAWFALSWAVAAISLRAGFGRRDQIPAVELSYSEETAQVCERRPCNFYAGENRLSGWILQSTSGDKDKGLIVIVHGLGAGADTHLAEAIRFVENGYMVLLFDGTGTRASEGWGVRGLTQGALDLDAALDFVRKDEQLKELPLIVYGHSMGGYAAAVVTASHPEIDGIVSICAFDKPLSEMMEMAKKKAGVIAYPGYPGLAMQYLVLFGQDGNRSAAKALSESKIPALIVAGAKDRVVPYEASLYAKKEEIDDPAASYLMIDEEGRAGHVGIWLSGSANRMRVLVQEGVMDPDPAGCNELDDAFMESVLAFMDASVLE